MDDILKDPALNKILEKIPTVPNMAIAPVVAPVIPPSDDFVKSSSEFWKLLENGKYRIGYDSGVINGSFNSQFATIDSIFGLFMSTLKRSVQVMGVTADKKTTDIDIYFKNLELAEKMLNEKINEMFKNEVDGVAILAYLHGTINNYIEQRMNYSRSKDR